MDFGVYLIRLEMFMKANKASDGLKVPTRLTLIGEEAFELLMTSVHPEDPTEMSCLAMKEKLSVHLAPEPSLATERQQP